MIIRKSSNELAAMARAGRVVVETIELVGEAMAPGVTTAELDEIAEEHIRSQGGVPTFKGYRGFPASICASPNSMVVHGIPGPYRLADGDSISIDVGVTLDGFVGDSAYTFAVGDVDPETQRLLDACQAALSAAIAEARAGNHVGHISAAVQRVTEEAGFSVVRSLVGHGVGRSMHEAPFVPNQGRRGKGMILQPGLVIAIEPMLQGGGRDDYRHDADGWTLRTADGSRAAHAEHTIAVTADGPRILTAL